MRVPNYTMKHVHSPLYNIMIRMEDTDLIICAIVCVNSVSLSRQNRTEFNICKRDSDMLSRVITGALADSGKE